MKKLIIWCIVLSLGFASQINAATAQDASSSRNKRVKLGDFEALPLDENVYFSLHMRDIITPGTEGGGHYESQVCVAQSFGRYASKKNIVDSCLSATPNDLNLRVQQYHTIWNGDAWQVCTMTDWVKQPKSDALVWIPVNHDSPTPACGDGYYMTVTRAKFKAPISNKKKNVLNWSGYVFLGNPSALHMTARVGIPTSLPSLATLEGKDPVWEQSEPTNRFRPSEPFTSAR